ncbi:hypothetical protein ACLMJK_003983 [Lecanora helva]
MKPLTLLFHLLITIPLVTSALPAFPRKTQQQKQLSPANSFSSDSSSSSIKNFKLTTLTSLLNPSSEFKCHSKTTTPIPLLATLSSHITTLLQSYRDIIFASSSSPSNNREMQFEECNAGYDAGNTSPSVYIGGLGKEAVGKVKTLLKNQVVGRFPGVRVVTGKGAVAVVVEEREGEGTGVGLRRRNTI